MEVREVFRLANPADGRVLNVHLTEKEVLDVMQAGLFTLMAQGWISFVNKQEAENIEVPEGSTPQ
jgi:hypothetical protein